MIDPPAANGIARVRGIKTQGVYVENRLTLGQPQTLINLPDTETSKGPHDKAVLAVMIGASLRRGGEAGLTFNHMQQRKGR